MPPCLSICLPAHLSDFVYVCMYANLHVTFSQTRHTFIKV